MVEIRPIRDGDIAAIAPFIKESDLIELRAVSTDSPLDALQASVAGSDLALTFHNGDEVLGIFGYQRRPQGAVVWMVSTPGIVKCGKSFTKQAKSIMNDWLARCPPVLWNYVYSGNHTTIEWLKVLGFDIHSTVPTYGSHMEPYHCMTKEKKE